MSDKVNQFATPIATLVTTWVSKKYALDNIMYGSLYSLCIIVITYLLSDFKDLLLDVFNFGSTFNFIKLLYLIVIIGFGIGIFYARNKLYDVYDKLYLSKYKSANIEGMISVGKLVNYMEAFKEFYDFKKDLSYSGGSIRILQSKQEIYFNDKNYGVTGTIKVVSELEIKIENCSTKNMLEYIENIMNHKITQTKQKFIFLDIVDNTLIQKILTYVNLNGNFYINTDIDTEMKNVNQYMTLGKIQIRFNDTRYNVSGFIRYSGNKIFFGYCELKEGTLQDYVRNICKYVDKYNEKSGKITLYELIEKKNGNGDIHAYINVFYDNKKMELKQLEQLFIKPFFHPQAESLWKTIKTINFHPEVMWNLGQAPRINLLLHGPPGTGKSTFAYRIAMLTGRHVINVKISNYDKDALHTMFTHPSIKGIKYCSRDVIYVLDEIDQDIKTLLLRRNNKNMQIEKAMSVADTLLENELKPKPTTINNIYTSQTGQLLTGAIAQPIAVAEKYPETKQTNTNDEKKSIVAEESSNIDRINKTVNETTKLYDKISLMNADIVTLDDLLTIFQGSVPNEGSIIIAMTNHFEEMREKCPALFRAGRLTPIYFGNFDIKMLNKVSKYYFNRPLSFTSKDIKTITTSQVIELAIDAKLHARDKFRFFCKRLKEFIPEVVIPTVKENKNIIQLKTKQNDLIQFQPFDKNGMSFSTMIETEIVADNDTSTMNDKLDVLVERFNRSQSKEIRYKIAELIYAKTSEEPIMVKIYQAIVDMIGINPIAVFYIGTYYEHPYGNIKQDWQNAITCFKYCLQACMDNAKFTDRDWLLDNSAKKLIKIYNNNVPYVNKEFAKLLVDQKYKEYLGTQRITLDMIKV